MILARWSSSRAICPWAGSCFLYQGSSAPGDGLLRTLLALVAGTGNLKKGFLTPHLGFLHASILRFFCCFACSSSQSLVGTVLAIFVEASRNRSAAVALMLKLRSTVGLCSARLEADISQVTHIYLASLCFEESTLFAAARKVQQASQP